jgi:hypothetical protein
MELRRSYRRATRKETEQAFDEGAWQEGSETVPEPQDVYREHGGFKQLPTPPTPHHRRELGPHLVDLYEAATRESRCSKQGAGPANCSGGKVEWGVQHVVPTLLLTEPVEVVLALIEGVGDPWRELVDAYEDWEFSRICTVDMGDAFLAHGQFPVLALSHSVIARIGSVGLDFDIVLT